MSVVTTSDTGFKYAFIADNDFNDDDDYNGTGAKGVNTRGVATNRCTTALEW